MNSPLSLRSKSKGTPQAFQARKRAKFRQRYKSDPEFRKKRVDLVSAWKKTKADWSEEYREYHKLARQYYHKRDKVWILEDRRARLDEYIALTIQEAVEFRKLVEAAKKKWLKSHRWESHCLRCGHDWYRRKKQLPGTCPNCNSDYWNKPRAEKKA